MRVSSSISYMDLLVINVHCEYNITSLGIRDCCYNAAQKTYSFFRVLRSKDVNLSSTSESSVKNSAIKQDQNTGTCTYLSGELSIPSRRNTQIPSLLVTKQIELGGKEHTNSYSKYEFTRTVSI